MCVLPVYREDVVVGAITIIYMESWYIRRGEAE